MKGKERKGKAKRQRESANNV